MRAGLLLVCLLSLFILTGCGYKPSSYYVKKELSGKIFVDLKVSLQDPRNSVIIKDIMNKLIVNRLDSQIVNSKELADTVLKLKLNSVSMQELQYDSLGYNKLYKAVVSILVEYKNKKSTKKNSFKVSSDYDFSIDNGTTITDTKRYEAIKVAAKRALDDVISKLAVSSFKE
ncbi:MAG: LPS assembly lipoprotein LptE [Halarcobacter sp.]